MGKLIFLLLTAIQAGAQAPVDSSFYAVSYVEVMPASKSMATAAFKQYRDTCTKDQGFVRFELFEQAGRNGHFVIIETWANQAAYDSHQTAGHTKQFTSQLQAYRTSDYDQRPYKVLTIASPAGAANRATFVISHVDIGGQGTDTPNLLRRLAEASRKEEGNIRFDVLQHAMRANHFTVIEAWKSEKALEAHAAAAHTKQYRDALAPITGSPLDERVFVSAQ